MHPHIPTYIAVVAFNVALQLFVLRLALWSHTDSDPVKGSQLAELVLTVQATMLPVWAIYLLSLYTHHIPL